MEGRSDEPPRGSQLPVDSGWGPDEEWPWRRSEDYGRHVPWKACFDQFIVIAGIGCAVAAGFPWRLIGFGIAVAGGLLAASFTAIEGLRAKRAPWRFRNLQAAEFRANRSLKIVDPEFAEQMRAAPLEQDGEGSEPRAGR